MADSSIEWTHCTWNPVAGCTIVTGGCTNCCAQDAAASSLIPEKAAAVCRCARLLKQASEIGDALHLIEIVDLLQDFVGALGR